MSQNKNRKSKFSSEAPSDIPSSRNDPYNPSYSNSFKPQTPSGQPPQNLQNSYNPSFPQNMEMGYSDPFSAQKFPYGNNAMNYNLPFYVQPQMMSQMSSGQKMPNPMEIQQSQYGSYNVNQQGGFQTPVRFQTPMGFQYPQSGQKFPENLVNNSLSNLRPESQMIEEKINSPQEKMEIISNENKNSGKRSRKDPRGVNEDFEVIHKKTKTESIYFERLETLFHELAKIKEFEVQILKTLFNTPQLNVSTLKTRKDFEEILKKRTEVSQIPFVTQNVVIQSALLSVTHEGLRNALVSLTNDKLKDQNEIEQIKKNLVAQLSQEAEEEKKEGRMEEELEKVCKVVHVNAQQFYQTYPQTKELEDKMDRLEYILKEKRGKIRDFTKKIGMSKMNIDIAQAKSEIATQKLQDMQLSNKG